MTCPRENNDLEKPILYWLDPTNNLDFKRKFTSRQEKEFKTFDLKMVETIAEVKDNHAKIIAVCSRTTHRLEHMLDTFLKNVHEDEFDRLLVIIVHNSDFGDIPHVPSTMKINLRNRYKALKHIIDVDYKSPTPRNRLVHTFTQQKRAEIVFCETIFKEFLKLTDKSETSEDIDHSGC
ncbi:uncharacterized protein LOC132733218 [Ruditapes philippinarum]|uniref:uncharacterized protein LOC132733218 n=1 Tax=Ruditapes philippinarum TaxID=129788 RepID=UPI00295B5DC7|nr:uncharacterized protein LOC132733218 [Ruditapes philippinarum]